jgi:hypothetical protein
VDEISDELRAEPPSHHIAAATPLPLVLPVALALARDPALRVEEALRALREGGSIRGVLVERT